MRTRRDRVGDDGRPRAPHRPPGPGAPGALPREIALVTAGWAWPLRFPGVWGNELRAHTKRGKVRARDSRKGSRMVTGMAGARGLA